MNSRSKVMELKGQSLFTRSQKHEETGEDLFIFYFIYFNLIILSLFPPHKHT